MIANHRLLLQCLMLACAAIVQLEAQTSATNGSAFRALHRQHLLVVRKFPCQTPQARTISVHRLLKNVSVGTSEMYQPSVTVLHRCDDGAGGCSQNSHTIHCVAVEQETVVLPFLLVDFVHNRREMRFERAQNHTLCACKTVEAYGDDSCDVT